MCLGVRIRTVRFRQMLEHCNIMMEFSSPELLSPKAQDQLVKWNHPKISLYACTFYCLSTCKLSNHLLCAVPVADNKLARLT